MPPPPIGTPRTNIPVTPLTPASQVVQPPASTNVVGTSGGLVIGIPSVPSASPSFAHTTQSGPIGSSSFVHGFPWNGGHIPPSTPYVGPTPTYVGVQFGNTHPYGQGFQMSVSAPFMSSPFSLFSRGIPALVFYCHLSHTWVTWYKYSSHLVCPWGKVSSQGCHLVLDSSIQGNS